MIPASPMSLKNVITSIERIKEYDPLFESGRVVEVIDNHTQIVYLKFAASACFVQQKRDFVLMWHWFEQKDGCVVITGRSVEHEDCKEDDPKCERGIIYSSGWIIRPTEDNPKKSIATYIVHADLKPASIPEFLRKKFITLVQQRQALNVLGVRKYVQKVRERQRNLYTALD